MATHFVHFPAHVSAKSIPGLGPVDGHNSNLSLFFVINSHNKTPFFTFFQLKSGIVQLNDSKHLFNYTKWTNVQ